MSKTNWEKMVYEKALNSAKSARRKQFDTLKIKVDRSMWMKVGRRAKNIRMQSL